MSDDLAAKAANWVPPWQRPAEDGSDSDAPPVEEAEASAESGAAGPWGRLAGAKWQNVQRDDADDDADADADDDGHGDDEALDEDLSDPQLSDCVSADETDDEPADAEDDDGDIGVVAEDQLGAVELLSEEREEDLAGDDMFVFPDGEGQGQLFVPAQRVADEKTSISEADLVPALEAILMVVDEPVGEATLAQVLEIAPERIAHALLDLSARYTEEGKGFDLRRAAGGWRFYTRSEYSAYVEKFVLDGQQLRLTQASLETLAVVAYKQPVTRSRISAIRGVNCDGVVKTLITRGLIEECGTEPESGAHLYRTTNLFLEKLGLDSVAQLPPLAPFLPDDLDEVAAQ